MPFKDTLEKVLLVLKVLFWLVMLATAVVSFSFVYNATDLMMERLERGEPPFAISSLVEPIDANALAERALAGALAEQPLVE